MKLKENLTEKDAILFKAKRSLLPKTLTKEQEVDVYSIILCDVSLSNTFIETTAWVILHSNILRCKDPKERSLYVGLKDTIAAYISSF